MSVAVGGPFCSTPPGKQITTAIANIIFKRCGGLGIQMASILESREGCRNFQVVAKVEVSCTREGDIRGSELVHAVRFNAVKTNYILSYPAHSTP